MIIYIGPNARLIIEVNENELHNSEQKGEGQPCLATSDWPWNTIPNIFEFRKWKLNISICSSADIAILRGGVYSKLVL